MKTIIINGTEYSTGGLRISFVLVVRMAFPDIRKTDGYTVTYRCKRKGGGKYPNQGGLLRFNEKIDVKDGMVFNVANTSKA